MQSVAARTGEHAIARLADEAPTQRLQRAAPLLNAVTAQLLGQTAAGPAWRGRVLRFADSSNLSEPTQGESE